MEYMINVGRQLMDLSEPKVMGILNVTPDSFHAASRAETKQAVQERALELAAQGAAIIDIGACSTRPGADFASEAEETERLRMALRVVRHAMPEAVLSVDTFRPTVAAMAVKEFGVDIINDVSGGNAEMFRLVSRLQVPYVLTSTKATVRDILLDFAEKVQQLRFLGQNDILLDPGFGFGKTLEQNYEILYNMEKLQVMELPLLVGLSRKTMIRKTLDITPAEALNGTTALNTIALMKGASVLRVHDVRESVECVKLVAATMPQHIVQE
jgi:dihydropteroate synthase